MCSFDGVQRDNFFGGEPIRNTEVEVRVGKLKNRKVAGMDEVNGEMLRGVTWWWTGFEGCAILPLKVL